MRATAKKVQTRKRPTARSAPIKKLAAPRKQEQQRLGLGLAILANVLWGTSFLASKQTLTAFSPITATFVRFAAAVVLMLAIFPLLRMKISLPRNGKEWKSLVLIALSGFGFLYPLQLAGLKSISSGLSASIMLTSPLFVLLLAASILKESLNRKKLVAIALGIGGGMLMLGTFNGGLSNAGSGPGILLTLLASLSLATSVVLTRKGASKIAAHNLTFWSMSIGMLMLAPFVAIEIFTGRAKIDKQMIATAAPAVLFLAGVCSVLCFYIWNKAIAMTPAKELASSMHIKTPVAVLLGVGIAHEVISLNIICGAVIIAFAVWYSQSAKSKSAVKT